MNTDEDFTFFYRSPLGQWNKKEFIVNRVEYNCAEQYMMAQKALLFRDFDAFAAIMKEESAKNQKAMGRLVKNFDSTIWDMNAKRIVFDGNYAKFTQNEDLQKLLLDTVGTTLVEASPIDKIWGIGLGEDDPRSLNRSEWQGLNWLGEVLVSVRDRILSENIYHMSGSA